MKSYPVLHCEQVYIPHDHIFREGGPNVSILLFNSEQQARIKFFYLAVSNLEN